MEVTVEDISQVKKKIHVQIPREDVARELDSAYNKLKKTAKIKGFRPGKAPRSTLERMFKKDVHSDVAGTLIQNSFIDAIKEKDLAILGTPEIDLAELDPDGPFTYNATVELKPDLSPIDFKGIQLIKTLYAVNEKEIEKHIELLQKQLAEYRPISGNRAAMDGDYIIIDYEGFKDDEPFEETQKTENYTMKIGDSAITEAFDEQITGLLPGEEKKFSIKFPPDYHNDKLADEEITFHVTLKEIREQVLPEVNDEMAKKLGNYKTLDELKEAIRKNLQEGYDRRSVQELQEQIFEKLLTENFEVPDSLVQMELDGIIYDTQMKFSQSNLSMEQLGLTREKMEEQYRDVAESQVRRHLFLGQIIKQEGLEITDEEMESEYESFAKALGQPVNMIKEYYKNSPDKLDAFKHALLEKKAFNLIIKNADIKEVQPEAEENKEKEEQEDSSGSS